MSTTSWRDVLPIHPAAELFPLMAPDELRALGADIKKNGLTSPIVLWRADFKTPPQLVDGRNRLDGIENTGRQVRVGVAGALKHGEQWAVRIDDKLIRNSVIVLCGPSVDPVAYVVSANVHRRHLTSEQKRDLIAKLIKANPIKSDRQIAKTVKASPTTVGTVRTDMEAKGDVSKLDTRRDSKGRAQPATKAKKTRTKPSAEEIAFEPAPATTRTRENIGPNSCGEIERLRARNEELEQGNRRLERENIALRSEIEELKIRAASSADDGLDIPAWLRRPAS
jgi:hypothetical protein